MNRTCLCLPSRSWYSFTDPRRDGRLSWPWVAGWLHAEISVRHRELNPDTVAHLSTNRARRRLTSFIEANVLTTTPDHQSEEEEKKSRFVAGEQWSLLPPYTLLQGADETRALKSTYLRQSEIVENGLCLFTYLSLRGWQAM